MKMKILADFQICVNISLSFSLVSFLKEALINFIIYVFNKSILCITASYSFLRNFLLIYVLLLRFSH